jgi:hypothetical protein
MVAFVVTMVYTVTFDGFAESPIYREIYFWVQETFGVGGIVSVLLYCLGLIGFVGGFMTIAIVVGRVITKGQKRAGLTNQHHIDSDGEGTVTTVLALGPTVLPIAAAYEFAHNVSYVLTYAGRLPTIVGAPSINPLWWLSLPLLWGAQVLLIVAGHIIAVVTADAIIRELTPTDQWAIVAHMPLLILMIGYTLLSLWIVSLPVAV